MKPLCIDLFAGMFGWSQGWLEQGGWVVGVDISHESHHGPVPKGADLILQDVHTIDGAQFKGASLILASPPCTEFSYMAMPWKRAKQIAGALRGVGEFPDGYRGSRTQAELTALFDACFRIQREASAAAGHRIPMVVENVRGACSWVGRSHWSFGSFHLWGNIPALMPMTKPRAKVGGIKLNEVGFNVQACRNLKAEQAIERETKNAGGSWFNVGGPGQKIVGQNPDGRKVKEYAEAVKGVGIGSVSWAQGKGQRHPDDPRNFYSGTTARAAASARIAKIPAPLARHIAHVYYPQESHV